MPDPNVSTDRERLLRLIDGGPEVIKEMQQQRAVLSPKPAEEKEPLQPIPAPQAHGGPKASALSEAQRVQLAQAVLAAIVVVFALYFFADVLKSKNRVPTAAAAATEGQLRLVGVDWSDAPVALLEDTVSGKTYFVRKNDTVRGARVKEIQKDHVSLFMGGKMVELR